MKKIFYILAIMVLIYTKVLGDCPLRAISISTQNDVIVALRDWQDCTIPNGLIISSSAFDPISDLSLLSAIKGVNGNLYIGNMTHLDNLSALSNIEFVNGELIIENNKSIIDYSALNNIKAIGGNFNFSNNQGVEELKILNDINSVGATISFKRNPDLKVINSFNSLQAIYGGLFFEDMNLEAIQGFQKLRQCNVDLSFSYISGKLDLSGFQNIEYLNNLVLYNCNMIENLKGFQKLHTMTGTIRISTCTSFKSFEGMENLEFVEGIALENLYDINKISNFNKLKQCFGLTLRNTGIVNANFNSNAINFKGLYIENNPYLKSISGFSMAENCNWIFIINNLNLKSIEPMSSIKQIEYLRVLNNGLEDLQFMSSLESVVEDFQLDNNSELQTLTGLENLKKVGFDFRITNSPKLSSIAGLQSLESVGGGFHLINLGMKSLHGLENLRHITNKPFYVYTIYEGFVIKHCQNLENLDGLENLETITSYFSLFSNNKLKSLTKFKNLELIPSREYSLFWFSIDSCSVLEDLSGLENLKAEERSVEFGVNYTINLTSLESFKGFPHQILDRIWFINNEKLNMCNVKPICMALVTDSIGVRLGGNGELCNVALDLLELCSPYDTSVDYISAKHSFYPNPSSGMFTIDKLIDNTAISVIDSRGNLIYKTVSVGDKVNLTPLPTSSYSILYLHEGQLHSANVSIVR